MPQTAPEHLGGDGGKEQRETDLQHRSRDSKCEECADQSAGNSTSAEPKSHRPIGQGAVGIMTKSEVPDATSWEKPKKKIRIGINKMPPPTPSMAEKTPTASPDTK